MVTSFSELEADLAWPKEFFRTVTSLNLKQAIENEGDYRLVVNAVLSVDALYGILFEALRAARHPFLMDISFKGDLADNKFKDYISSLSYEFQIVRDAAYAVKHGRLTGKKARLLAASSDVSLAKLGSGLLACGDELGGSAVLFMIKDREPERSWYVLRKVEMFTEKLLNDLVI